MTQFWPMRRKLTYNDGEFQKRFCLLDRGLPIFLVFPFLDLPGVQMYAQRGSSHLRRRGSSHLRSRNKNHTQKMAEQKDRRT